MYCLGYRLNGWMLQMSKSRIALTYNILILISVSCQEVYSSTHLELTTSNACTQCECKAGEYANDFVVCDGEKIGRKEINILTLPHYINSIEVSNFAQVYFKRGAIRISEDRKFSIKVKNVKFTQMDDKSLTLISPSSRLQLFIEKVNELNLKRRFVSAKAGNVEVSIDLVDTVSVEGRAFDVLDRISMKSVNTLKLEQLSFKPNVSPPLQQPQFIAEFMNIQDISSIPPDSFPSAARISFTFSNISDIETNAFSGNQMSNLTFKNSSIDRIHTHAFPGKSLIVQLQFHSCALSSISEKAIASAISLLEVIDCKITSISEEAFHCPVAKVILYHSTFSTISTRTFLFQSWSNLTIELNQFKFVESGAFEEISGSGPDTKFSFKGNHIHYANQNALRLQKLHSNIEADVSNNVFHKECECDYHNWLDKVCSPENSKNPETFDFRGLIQNTSLCAVPSFATGCFDKKEYVSITSYIRISCGYEYNEEYSDEVCIGTSLSTAWDNFQEQLEVTTNKGILLIVLLFVLASSLVVGILTLFRWIVYSFQMRGKYADNDDEWNFTKVEERLITNGSDEDINPTSLNGSLIQHYESLPLTTTEVLMESTPSSSPTKITNPDTINKDPKSNKSSIKSSPMHHNKTSANEIVCNGDESEKEKLLNHSSFSNNTEKSTASNGSTVKLSKPNPNTEGLESNLQNSSLTNTPKQSFFDEMIDLLTEKLEDPDNYGTVLDTNTKPSESNAQQILYQDPVTLSNDV